MEHLKKSIMSAIFYFCYLLLSIYFIIVEYNKYYSEPWWSNERENQKHNFYCII